MKRLVLLQAALISTCSALAQTGTAGTPSLGLELLQRVTARYADATSYDLETVEERTTTNDLFRTWQKTTLIAAEASGGRFHYEAHTGSGSAINVSDGQTVWTYRIDEHRYTAKPNGAPKAPATVSMSEFPLLAAQSLKRNLAQFARNLKTADRLPDATISVRGRNIQCLVVHFQSSDRKRATAGYSFEKTVWIDKSQLNLVRTVEHAQYSVGSGASRIPVEEEIETVFLKSDLNGLPEDNLFRFSPPADAKLLADFPDPAKEAGGAIMTGLEAPDLKLNGADGKTVTLKAFKGKPVILDIWATWCRPCVDALPQLAQIAKEGKDKGIVLLSIDNDEEPGTASKFLSSRGYTWKNYHDGDGAIETLVGASGIPRTMLIDAQGRVTYDSVGMDENSLRTEIAKLGPAYAALAPKRKAPPCKVEK